MGRGHGGSRGGGGAKGFQGDASMRGMSAGLAKALTDREADIRGNDNFEKGTVYDTEGNVIFNNDKGRNGSVFLGSDFENRIVTHNHPINEKGKNRADEGGSLSKTDLMLASFNNTAEIRAVTRHYTYSLKRPAQGWGVDSTNGGYVLKGMRFKPNADRQRVSKVYNSIQKKADTARLKYIREYKGDKAVARRRSFAVYYHQINREFAKQMGWEYSKTRVN
jgi:hypothetical protein